MGVKLSILIPVFNWDATALLERLLTECAGSAGDIEILVADDSSSDGASKERNEAFIARADNPVLKYFPLTKNLGRAAIRNFLVKRASADFLLFLDCDVIPDTGDFLRAYLSSIQTGDYEVICGGISYQQRILAGRDYDYRVYFGNKKEAAPADVRNIAPGRHLLTANVLVRKEAFLQTPFDEGFVGYGYEDMDWGLRLARQWRVLHIDNTVSHLGLDKKVDCFAKMRASVPNYLRIREKYPDQFRGAIVGKVAEVLSYFPAPFLAGGGNIGGRLISAGVIQNLAAFGVMQVSFSLFLALGIKSGR